MGALLENPAVQAGVAPFAVALAVAAALHRTRLLVLCAPVAFALAVGLTIGFSFDALTATRKLVIAALVAAAVAAALEAGAVRLSHRLGAALVGFGAAAGIWVVWRVLQQQSAPLFALWSAGAALYCAVLIASSLRAGEDPVRACATALVLGLGAGALAFLGASALLAQLGIALAAGSGAALLVQMVLSRRAPVGWTLALPVAVAVSALGVQAVLTGPLPWYCLVPLLGVPWTARLVAADQRPVWLVSVLTALAAAVPMLLSVAIAWFTAGT
jgi:hypothetical protein